MNQTVTQETEEQLERKEFKRKLKATLAHGKYKSFLNEDDAEKLEKRMQDLADSI